MSKAQEFVDIYRYPPSRPAPIYPTPQVDKPAAKCRKDVCLLPDCSCGGGDIPGKPGSVIDSVFDSNRRGGEGEGSEKEERRARALNAEKTDRGTLEKRYTRQRCCVTQASARREC